MPPFYYILHAWMVAGSYVVVLFSFVLHAWMVAGSYVVVLFSFVLHAWMVAGSYVVVLCWFLRCCLVFICFKPTFVLASVAEISMFGRVLTTGSIPFQNSLNRHFNNNWSNTRQIIGVTLVKS